MTFTSPYSNLFARLVSNVVDEGDCWIGTERKLSGRRRCRYIRINVRVPGLKRHIGLMAHIVTWVYQQLEAEGLPTDMDSVWLAYHEFRCSGLELHHKCETPRCRRPLHLEPVTRIENEHQKRRPVS